MTLSDLSPAARRRLARSLTDEEAAALLYDWPSWARPEQLEPPGDWVTWLILSGRGWGKTRTGAEWVRAKKDSVERIALVAPTAADARDVLVEGESGLLAVSPPWDRPVYEPSRRRVVWSNGSIATLYSADEPDRLRGPQAGAAWCDEIATWRYLTDAWDNLQFGLRLGARPRVLATTTPRPLRFIRRLMESRLTHVTRGATHENLVNLAPSFREAVVAKYEGTRLGRQELMGEIVDDIPGALWTWAMIDAARVSAAPPLERIVVAVDPPASSGPDASECGIVCAGLASGVGYVLDDWSEGGLSPEKWAQKAVDLYRRRAADRIVIEVNQGGEMAESVLRQIDKSVPIRKVHASRGKKTRAEPVSALYEKERVRHVGGFARLEEQMCEYDGTGSSPDRLDALVWALTDLMLDVPQAPYMIQQPLRGYA